MGSGCSSCQAENQCILSDTISLHQKFKSDQIQQNVELEPCIRFQQCPNKQYSGYQHPELELKSQDDMILDISDEFFASINIQEKQDEEKQDEEKSEDSICLEFWSQQTIISNFRSQSSEIFEHQTININSFQNKKNGKKVKNISAKQQEKKKQQKKKYKNKVVSKFQNNISYYNFEYSQVTYLQKKLCHSYQIISILKTPEKRRFRSMTPQKKQVRFNLNKQKFQ